MGFEKFEGVGSKRGRPLGADPMVSLRKSGNIGINRAALEAYFADDDGAVMYYDGDNARIGIEPVADSDADAAAYSVTKTDSGVVAVVVVPVGLQEFTVGFGQDATWPVAHVYTETFTA